MSTILDRPSYEVVHDDRHRLDAVLADDVVPVDGKIVNLPGRGKLASWLVDVLQKKALYATRMSYAGKEGVPRRSTLGKLATDVYERGYIRPHTEEFPYVLTVREFDEQGEKLPGGVEITYRGEDGTDLSSLPAEDRDEIKEVVDRLYRSFSNRYASIGLTLASMDVRVGRTSSGGYKVVGFPGTPESSEILGPHGEPWGRQLLKEGKSGEFLDRYQEILSLLGMKSIPVRPKYLL